MTPGGKTKPPRPRRRGLRVSGCGLLAHLAHQQVIVVDDEFGRREELVAAVAEGEGVEVGGGLVLCRGHTTIIPKVNPKWQPFRPPIGDVFEGIVIA